MINLPSKSPFFSAVQALEEFSEFLLGEPTQAKVHVRDIVQFAQQLGQEFCVPGPGNAVKGQAQHMRLLY